MRGGGGSLARNQWLTRSLAQLREYTGPYRRVLLRNEHYRRETLDQMWNIYTAIRDRQPAEAGARMRAHILDFRDKVLNVVSDASTNRERDATAKLRADGHASAKGSPARRSTA